MKLKKIFLKAWVNFVILDDLKPIQIKDVVNNYNLLLHINTFYK